jgi:hypothetical protein
MAARPVWREPCVDGTSIINKGRYEWSPVAGTVWRFRQRWIGGQSAGGRSRAGSTLSGARESEFVSSGRAGTADVCDAMRYDVMLACLLAGGASARVEGVFHRA